MTSRNLNVIGHDTDIFKGQRLDNSTVQTAAMGQIPRSTERILVSSSSARSFYEFSVPSTCNVNTFLSVN